MKKIILILISIALIIPFITFAHPGGTDSSGCHTCRTNCGDWGLSYGEYHCHNNRGSTQPKYPIHSTYGLGGTGYTTPAPDYAYPSYSTIPSCPLMSRYDSLSGGCKCLSGYVADIDLLGKETCILADSKCTDLLGYGGQYDSLSNKCECRYGYLYNGKSCVSETIFCNDQIGLMSRYDSLSNKCECMSGYEFDGFSCVIKKTDVQLCQDSFGINSYATLSGKCGCNVGYEWATDNKSCVKSISCYGDDIKVNNECITLNESCQNSYGSNSIGVIGSKKLNDSGECKCKDGYEWNSNKTFCSIARIPVLEVPIIEPIIKSEEKQKDSITEGKVIKDIKNKKTDEKKVSIVEQKEEPKIETIPEPIQKIKWYQKIFNWFRGQ